MLNPIVSGGCYTRRRFTDADGISRCQRPTLKSSFGRTHPPDSPTSAITISLAAVECERQIGGLLKHYFRKVAQPFEATLATQLPEVLHRPDSEIRQCSSSPQALVPFVRTNPRSTIVRITRMRRRWSVVFGRRCFCTGRSMTLACETTVPSLLGRPAHPWIRLLARRISPRAPPRH